MSREAVAAVYIFLLLVGLMVAFSIQVAVKNRFLLKWALWTVVAAGFALALISGFGARDIDLGAIVAMLFFAAFAGGWMAIGGSYGIAAWVAERRARDVGKPQ